MLMIFKFSCTFKLLQFFLINQLIKGSKKKFFFKSVFLYILFFIFSSDRSPPYPAPECRPAVAALPSFRGEPPAFTAGDV